MTTHFIYSERQAMQAMALCAEMAGMLSAIVFLHKKNQLTLTDDALAGIQRLLDRQEKLALAQ